MAGAQAMLLPVMVLLCMACISPAQALVCYSGGPDLGYVIATVHNKPGILCARYQFPCSKDDSACTAQDVAAGKLRWAYTMLKKGVCDQLKAMPGTYKDLLCCSINFCNAPDPKRDTSTKINPGLLTPSDGPPTAPAPKTAGPNLKCYIRPPDAAPITVKATEVVDSPGYLCLRYQYLCTPNDKECAPGEVGKLKWHYSIAEKNSCDSMKALPERYRDLTCCSTNLCNAPDPKRDPTTKVTP